MSDPGTDFAHTPRRRRSNEFWLAPSSLRADADQEPPDFPVGWTELADALDRVLKEEPRLELRHSSADNHRKLFVQRSKLFRFPDRITVEFIPRSDTSSTLAIHSASVFGLRDYGVNRERVRRWLNNLEREIGRETS
ncbi:MAG: DUF1499 domain-containing protein [Geminicoccaceae bacterium]